jgi:3-deoxy-D-manno-octulosonic-acid transferase
MKFIFVPHEVNHQNINSLKAMFGNEADLYTKHKSSVFPSNKRVMIVDTVGLLNSIYQYATYCYVGGGFGVGIHNTLEAAAYGKPVFFGPNYQKFSEAKSLIQINASKSISSSSELIEQIKLLESNNATYLEKCTAAKNFVLSEKGATEKIITQLKKENYLLS